MRSLPCHVWSCFLFPGHCCIEIFDPSRVCAWSCRLVSLLQALSIVIHMWHPMWFCQTYGLQGSWNNRALVGFFWRLFRRTLSRKDADKGELLILYSCCNFKVFSVNSCASSVVYTLQRILHLCFSTSVTFNNYNYRNHSCTIHPFEQMRSCFPEYLCL